MLLGLRNREAIRAISPALEAELDSMLATISQTFTREHDEQGKHTNINYNSITKEIIKEPFFTQGGTPSAQNYLGQASGQHWTNGPWIFDNLNGVGPEKCARTLTSQGGTFNDFDSIGFIDNAIILEINPTGNLTLNGIKQSLNYKRLLIVGNVGSSSKTITLKHENTGSVAKNRFSLPGATDLVLADGQFAWLFYSVVSQRWRLFVTGQQSGGTGSIPASSALTVASVTLTNDQWKALNTTPITVVSAPGAGKAIILVSFTIQKDNSAGAYTGSGNYTLRYSGLTTTISESIQPQTTSADVRWFTSHMSLATIAFGTDSIANRAVVIRGDIDLTGGNAANVMKVTVAYHVVDAI